MATDLPSGATPSLWSRFSAWVVALVSAPVRAREKQQLEVMSEQLKLLLAARIAEAWRGVTGRTAAQQFTEGLAVGGTAGAAITAVFGPAAPLGAVIGAAVTLLTATVYAIIPLEKENLRARFNDEVRKWSPIERYLCVALLRPVVAAARVRDKVPALSDSWRLDGGGFKTVFDPLFVIAGHFHLESLYEGPWPDFEPSVSDSRTLYVLAAAVSSEDDGARLDSIGSMMSTGRAGCGPWYRAAYMAAGRPDAGRLRAMARGAGLDGLTDVPLGEWARPLIEEALKKRGVR